MLRVFVRFGGVLGLAALVLALAGGVLGAPVARSGVIQLTGAEPLPQAAPSALDFTIVLSSVVGSGGLNQPVGIVNAGDGSGRLFVLEQAGYIRVIKNGVLLSTPYLTVTNQVLLGSEQGLLGLVFDPDFATNGTFYINYSASASGFEGDTVIARYRVAGAAADVANVINVTNILTITQPQSNHNGGDLVFGPDGYLYVGMGDGGNSNDEGPGHAPQGNGQSPSTLLGKMLRINVRGVPTYTIPATNPFTQTAGYRPEIWALGLRNPWRYSFDRATGDLYIGDVGQNCWEEIDYQPASSHGGENYGWRLEEGSRQFDTNDAFNCNMPVSTLVTTTKPITAYVHPIGSAVTGGYVYRGQQYPQMQGVYFYSDSGSGIIWAIQQVSPGVWSSAHKLDTPYGITSFGEDENGELYVTDYSQGGIYKITSPSQINFSTSSKSVSTGQASVGSTVTYTIVVRNTGDLFSNVVRVTDTVPTGLSYVAGSLAATSGAIDAASAPTLKWNGVMSPTAIVTITFRAQVTAGGNSIITNTATIDPALLPPFTRSATLVTSGPSLSGSTKQVSASTAQWNKVLTYTIVLRSNGDPFANTVHVTDTLPAGLNYLTGTLTATRGTPDDSAAPTLKWNGDMIGTSAVTISYRAVVTTYISQTLNNTALIDPVFSVPFARSAAVTISGPNLANTAKQVAPNTARSGESVTYTIVLRNTGATFPTTVRVTDTVPASLNYLPGSLTATSGTTDASAAPTLKWNGVMSTTPIVTLTYAVTVAAMSSTSITNSVSINPGYAAPFARTALLLANPRSVFLPVILRN